MTRLSAVRIRHAVLLAAFVAVTALPAAPAHAAPEPSADYVKYYLVTTAAPSSLPKIAERFLGDRARADEIVQLNRGRKQPDGRALTSDRQRPAAGWVLVLPWDAVGTGVRYGSVTATGAAVPAAPQPAGPSAGPLPSSAGPAAVPALGGSDAGSGTNLLTVAGAVPGAALLVLVARAARRRAARAGLVPDDPFAAGAARP